MAWPQVGRCVDGACFCRQGGAILERDPLLQACDLFCLWNSFDLYQVGFPGFIAWVAEALLQLAIVGEQQQSFAVAVESAGGIDCGDVDIVSQGLASFSISKLDSIPGRVC